MISIKHLKTTCIVAAAGTILVAAGCSSHETDTYHSQAEISETETLEHTQMHSGARADSTMYPSHFDGPTLSSLGTAKLDLMLADTHSTNPLVVYMAIPDDNYAQDRRLAVGRYLEDRGGIKPEQIEFQSGPNPKTYYPVNEQLPDYVKTDTASDMGSYGGGGGAAPGK